MLRENEVEKAVLEIGQDTGLGTALSLAAENVQKAGL